MVSEMILRVTGKHPETTLSPDEAVARGAAIYAGMLLKTWQWLGTGSTPTGECELAQSGHRRTGPEDETAREHVLIPRNTPLPARAQRAFPLAKSHQRRVVIPIVEGEARQPDDCVHLGKCMIDDLPDDLSASKKVVVEYTLDASGLITVAAGIPGARRGARVQITRNNARDLGSLDAWCEQLRSQARDPAEIVCSGCPSSHTRVAAARTWTNSTYSSVRWPCGIQFHKILRRTSRQPCGSFATWRWRKRTLRQPSNAKAKPQAGQNASKPVPMWRDAKRVSATCSSNTASCCSASGRLVVQHRIVLPESDEIVHNIERIQHLFA